MRLDDKDLTIAVVTLNAVGRNDLAKKVLQALTDRKAEKLISDHRLSELVDYATHYGDFDKNTEIGTVSSNGTALTEIHRDNMLALLELQFRRTPIPFD